MENQTVWNSSAEEKIVYTTKTLWRPNDPEWNKAIVTWGTFVVQKVCTYELTVNKGTLHTVQDMLRYCTVASSLCPPGYCTCCTCVCTVLYWAGSGTTGGWKRRSEGGLPFRAGHFFVFRSPTLYITIDKIYIYRYKNIHRVRKHRKYIFQKK